MKVLKNFNTIMTVSTIVLITLMFLITGCKSNSSSSAGVKGFASGVITAKGSIFVNGIEYETTSSAVMVDNMSGGDSDLKVGMVVDVKGTIDASSGTGVADKVDYASSIEGTVDSGSIDTVAGTFKVFGLDILTDASTVYEGIAGLSALAVGNRVEVSGVSNGTAILASRVEVNSDTSDYKVRGTISLLSANTDGSFTLTMKDGDTLTVNFTGTLDAGIANSSEVKVEISTAPVAGAVTTVAGKIELKHELSIDEGDRVEVEGIVSDFVSGTPDTFKIGDVSISATSDLTAGVSNGIEIEVKGNMESGVLVATEIGVREAADFEIKGVVTASDTATGTLVINGVTVYVTHDTIFFDDMNIPVPQFGLDDLTSGNSLEVKMYYDTASGHLVAVKLERHEADTQAVMNGTVSAINTTFITVNGLSIDTTPLFVTIGGRDTFLSTLTAGTTVVKLIGTISGTTVTWSTVALD